MALSGKQCSQLRSLAHHQAVAVTIGSAGLTPSVIAEIDAALTHHELIKVKLPGLGRKERQTLLEQAGVRSRAEIVQHIGRIGVLYRPGEEPVIVLA